MDVLEYSKKTFKNNTRLAQTYREIKNNCIVDFNAGYEECKTEYEEKLRWIPIEEKLPPLNQYVLFKYSEDEYCVGCLNVYGYYCSPYIPEDEDFASINLLSEVTHWKHFL